MLVTIADAKKLSKKFPFVKVTRLTEFHGECLSKNLTENS